MYYEIVAESDNYYKVIHYFNIYDYRGFNRTILKRNFGAFASTKIDKTDYNKIEFIEKTIQQNVVEITDKQKYALGILDKLLQDRSYIYERDINIKKCSKAFVGRIISNEKLLQLYNLKRVRLNKKLKQELKINKKGYPYIILKKTYKKREE